MSEAPPEPSLLSACDQSDPVVEIEPGPQSLRAPDREPSPYAPAKDEELEVVRPPEADPHASRYPETEVPGTETPIVKPIETISAMDLLMQDVEEPKSGSDPSDS